MEITPPEDREICRSIDFAPRGPRDCPRAKPEGNLEGRGLAGLVWSGLALRRAHQELTCAWGARM